MNNTHQSGFFRPVRDFMPAVNAISQELFNTLSKHLEKNSRITDMLIPFARRMNVVVEQTNSIDFGPYPKDYSCFSSARILMQKELPCVDKSCEALKNGECIPAEDLADFFPVVSEYTEVEITDVSDSKFASAVKHVTKRPTTESPIGTRIAEGYQIYPRGIGVILMSYYRNPAPAVMDYTVRVSGVDEYIDYKKASSVQLEWSQQMVPAFLYKLSMRYGLFVDDQLKMQVGHLANELL
jgi:hypothetical protein